MYVIYEIESTYILKARARSAGCYVEYYKSESAAKAALTRLEKKGKLGQKVVEKASKENGFRSVMVDLVKSDFAIAEVADFRQNIEKKVVRNNLMSGEEFEEAVNTPNYCSPSSEAYWSM